MFLIRAKAWLPKLSWWRRKEGLNQQKNLMEKLEGSMERTDPPKRRWWSGHWLLETIGWNSASGASTDLSASGDPALLAKLPQRKSSLESPEQFQICFNFVRHLFDLCVVTLLCASSPAFRLVLDILGFSGALKVWTHGFACFLVIAYGMYLALWLVQEYLLQFACLYGFLQTLVLWVSIRAGAPESQEDEREAELDTGQEESSTAERCKQDSSPS